MKKEMSHITQLMMRNNELYAKYKVLADAKENVIFGGRLAQYKYFDMHNIIAEVLLVVEKELS